MYSTSQIIKLLIEKIMKYLTMHARVMTVKRVNWYLSEEDTIMMPKYEIKFV